jgi:ribose transport system ATP-binding protein
MSVGLNGSQPGGGSPATRSAQALHVDGVAKSFSGKTVLHPFDLRIASGEIHALLGQNGSGKSTLIKVLSGFHLPDPGGTCLVNGEPLTYGSADAAHRLGLRFVHQELGLIDTSSILDNLMFGRGFPTRFGTIRDKTATHQCAEALRAVGLDVDPHALVATLTPAQRTGVAVARALFGGDEPATVLVLDEPTATLPTEEVNHLHATLRHAVARGVAILYVTHYLDEVYQLADRVSVLRDGHLVVTSPVGDIKRQTLVHHLIGGELEGVRREIGQADHTAASGDATLSVRDLYADPIRGVSLTATTGEIVGVYGLTGSGRESLLSVIFGATPRESGEVHLSGKPVRGRPDRAIAAGIGYLPPDRKTSGGFMLLSAAENLTLPNLKPFWARGWLSGRAETVEAREWFDRLQVRPSDGIRLPLGSFSGGNQQKVLFGKWLRLAPKVLLLDEPTQGVDVGAKAELHRQIINAGAAGAIVVISSSDVEELATLCDRVLIMREGRVAEELTGDDVTEKQINRSSHQAATLSAGTMADDQ